MYNQIVAKYRWLLWVISLFGTVLNYNVVYKEKEKARSVQYNIVSQAFDLHNKGYDLVLTGKFKHTVAFYIFRFKARSLIEKRLTVC